MAFALTGATGLADQAAPTQRGANPTQPSGAGLAWPEPPAPARIRFIRVLTPESSRGRPSFVGRLWRTLVGRDDPPTLTQPYGLTVDPLDRLVVADTTGRALHVMDLGKPGYRELAVDGDSLIGVAALGGRLFVTASASNRVSCLDAKGKVVWKVGPEIGLVRPTGIVAAGDRLHVVDTLAHRVVTLDASGNVLGGFGSHGGEPGRFNFPTNIARGPDGRLFVTDSMNFRVQIFSSSGEFLSTFGQIGDGSGDFNKPKGIAVDRDGHIYVVEGLHDVVQVFDDRGQFLLAFGESGTAEGQFWLPTGIAIANDFIYVADSSNRRVQVFQYVGEGR